MKSGSFQISYVLKVVYFVNFNLPIEYFPESNKRLRQKVRPLLLLCASLLGKCVQGHTVEIGKVEISRL